MKALTVALGQGAHRRPEARRIYKFQLTFSPMEWIRSPAHAPVRGPLNGAAAARA
jgi:hypothetical protein